MPKPSELLMSGGRSERATASDAYQEQLAAQRQRVFAILFWGLIVVETVLWYCETPEWVVIAIPIAWLGLLIHNNALLILHELWEINDQLAGRKDEFSNIVSSHRLRKSN